MPVSGHPKPSRLGRYEIVGELGRGAMGVVYEGRDTALGRRVAIKTARRDVMEASGMAEEMMERFLREAKSTAALEHQNIITVYDAGSEGDVAYIAMEFLDGGNLRDLLDTRRRLSPEEVAEIGATICEALAVAHAQGIVHRDIKPANIMTPVGKPIKLADFGIAHIADSNLTQDGALVGTPHYMSPEQFMGQRLDGRSDLFSVGVMLYELLTGEKPFPGEALTTVMHNVMKAEPEEPRQRNYHVNGALSRVIMKSMAKRPQDRYPDGRTMAAALRESLLPNPDPAVLGFEPPAPDKPEEDTLVPDAPEATSSKQGDAGDTLMSRKEVRPEDIETIDLAAPLAETSASPQLSMSESTLTRLKRETPPSNRWPLLLAALLAVATIGVALYWAVRDAAPAQDEPEIPVMALSVYYTLDGGIAGTYPEGSLPALASGENRLWPLGGGVVEVVDSVSGARIASATLDAQGKATIDMRGRPMENPWRIEVRG
ncbi:MAG: hypothetical protein RLZZ303_3180, partial [Candidatus Hydrogenedentota bacterium]